ncbi:MAG: 30S ribosomal protein S24e [Promethearchaeota archaeon]
MKIKIEEKQENPLLSRQDITFQVDHSGEATPPRIDVRAKLAAMLNCKEDQLYIVKFNGLYGQSTTHGYAHLYPSKEVALSLEQKHILKRHATEEETTPPAMEIPEPALKEPQTPKEKPEPKAEKPVKEKEPEKAAEKKSPQKEKKKEELKVAPTKEDTSPKEKPKPEKKKKETPSEKKEAP